MQESPLATASTIFGILTFAVAVVAIVIFGTAISRRDGDARNAQIADIMTTAAQYVSEAGVLGASQHHDSEETNSHVDQLLQTVYQSALKLNDSFREVAASRIRKPSLWYANENASHATLLCCLREMQGAMEEARRLRLEARIDDLHR